MNFLQAVAAARRVPVAPSGIVTSGLIHHWNPYQIAGTNLPDSAGTDDLTLYNGLDTSVNLPWMDCDGVNDYAGAGTNYTPLNMKFQYDTPFSVGIWIKVAFTDSETRYPVLLNSMQTAAPYSGFSIAAGVGGSRTGLAVVLRYNAYNNYERSFMQVSLAQNTPYYFLATYPGVRNQNFKIYLNGVQVSDTGNTVGSGTPTIPYNNELRLGNWFGSTNPWLGSIGAAHIYDKELTAAEVLQNFDATKTIHGL